MCFGAFEASDSDMHEYIHIDPRNINNIGVINTLYSSVHKGSSILILIYIITVAMPIKNIKIATAICDFVNFNILYICTK